MKIDIQKPFFWDLQDTNWCDTWCALFILLDYFFRNKLYPKLHM